MSILIFNPNGISALPNAKIAANGIGYNGKLLVSTTSGKVWRFANDAWTQVADVGDLVNSAKCWTVITRNSADILFSTWGDTGSTTGKSGIYRSTDDGDTWARVCPPVGDTEWGDDTSARAIVEDDLGGLWAGAYPKTGDHPNLYYSADDGVTWTLVKTFTGEKHIHSIYWCPFRKVLLAATGDLAGASKIKYTDDYGATWSDWSQSVQAISMTSDADFIYGTNDNGADRTIWRAADPGSAITTVYAGVVGTASWMIDIDEHGHIIAFFTDDGGGGKYIAVSDDQGATWAVLSTAIAVGAYCLPSKYYGGNWDRFYYSSASSGSFGQVRALPDNYQFLQKTDGIDWLNSPTNGWKTLKAAAVLSSLGYNINPAGYSSTYPIKCGSRLNGASAFSSDFSSAPTWTATSGTIDSANTEQAYSGTKCLKASGTSSYATKDITSVGSGGTIWLRGYVFFGAVADGTYFDIAVLRTVGATATISLRMGTDRKPFIRTSWSPATNWLQGEISKTAFPVSQWTKVEIAVYVHATLGSITVWMDGKIVINVIGINTLPGGVSWSTGRFGLSTDGSANAVYWDDVALGVTAQSEFVTSRAAAQYLGPLKKSLKQVGEVYEWQPDPQLLAVIGVNNACFGVDGTPVQFATPALALAAMATLADDQYLFAGTKAAALYSVDMSAQATRIKKIVGD